MNLSFLLLLLPGVYIDAPIQIILSLLSLSLSSLLFHNIEFHEKFPFLLEFDQINIINTCIMITFDSWSLSAKLILLSILERIFFIRSGGFTCMFVYFICFLKNYTNNVFLMFFLFNVFLYSITNLQHRDFSDIERYLWHASHAMYITIALTNKYVPRLTMVSHRTEKKKEF
jgi:hypothetical protein